MLEESKKAQTDLLRSEMTLLMMPSNENDMKAAEQKNLERLPDGKSPKNAQHESKGNRGLFKVTLMV